MSDAETWWTLADCPLAARTTLAVAHAASCPPHHTLIRLQALRKRRRGADDFDSDDSDMEDLRGGC